VVPAVAAAARTQVPALPRTDTEDLLARAQRHADGGRLDQAGNVCRDVLARVPGHAGAWFLLGMIHECAGDVRTAERSWRRCVYLDPDHYEALCALALLHERMGDGEQGAGLRRRAARIFERRGRSAS
jgi:chemotaxis protein methyltransferase WspC